MANNAKAFNTQQSLNSAIKSICDIMRRSNCAGALQYVPELTWILFLRILDEQEAKDAERAEAVAADLMQSLESPYRWQVWAAPPDVGARHGVPLRSECRGMPLRCARSPAGSDFSTTCRERGNLKVTMEGRRRTNP